MPFSSQADILGKGQINVQYLGRTTSRIDVLKERQNPPISSYFHHRKGYDSEFKFVVVEVKDGVRIDVFLEKMYDRKKSYLTEIDIDAQNICIQLEIVRPD